MALICPLESRTRVLAAVAASPPLITMVPALAASSPSFAITSMNPLGGGPWFSECLTIIMNRIFFLLVLRLETEPSTPYKKTATSFAFDKVEPEQFQLHVYKHSRGENPD
jgi:hypothetical protein